MVAPVEPLAYFVWAHFCSPASPPGQLPFFKLLPKAALSMEQEGEGEQGLCFPYDSSVS